MAGSNVRISPNALAAGSRPKLVQDLMIRRDTLCLVDFTNPLCHPGGTITPGAAPVGTQFADLVSGIAGTVVGPSWTINSDGTLTPPGAGGTAIGASYIGWGGAGQFDVSATNPDLLFILWFKVPSSGHLTTNYLPLANLTSTDANHAQVWLDLGVGGVRPRVQAGLGASAIGGPIQADMTLDAVHQLSQFTHPSTYTATYYDGAYIIQNNGITAFQSAASAVLKLAGNAVVRFYGFALVNMTACQADEAALGFSQSDILSGAQHIAKDFAYHTGGLAGDGITKAAWT